MHLNKTNTLANIVVIISISIGLGIFSLITLFSNPLTTYADQEEIKALSDKISDKRAELERLDKEIAEQRRLLMETSGQSVSLQNKVNELEASRKKIITEINQTQVQIEKAELTINKLDLEITDKQKLINEHSGGVADSIRRIHNLESISIVEKFLSSGSFSEFWLDYEQTLMVQQAFQDEIDELLDISDALREDQTSKQIEKELLAKYKIELDGQAEAVESTKSEQQKILAATKNKEEEYKRLVAQKEAEKKAFEQELLEIESQLKFLIDPDSYPTAASGIFSWPLANIIVTQEFGGSQFAKTNPGVYGRAFHPGTDFGVPIGTKVMSIGPGIIKGTGNTDAFPGCNAWGKWILVEHDNGISSLYAHLSSILVSPGQRVTAGESIALSGNTGISTGPHLHLTLYASQGVKIGRYGEYKAGTGCSATDATGPFADLDAYLDPMDYLPN